MFLSFSRLLSNETNIFFRINSNYFQFKIKNETNEFEEINGNSSTNQMNISLPQVDKDKKLTLYFESKVVGLYDIKFYTKSKFSDVVYPIQNGT